MAKLQPYTANLTEPGTGFVPATPGAAGAAVGVGLEKLGRGAHLLYEQMGEDESRQAIVGSAQVRAKYAKALDDATLSGGNTAPLKEKMNDELSKIGEDFSTRKGQDSLAQHTATTNLMFDEQANRIAVSRASDQARVQGDQFLSNAAAAMQSSPATLPIWLRNAEEMIDTFKISPEKRAIALQDIRTKLNMSAATSSARIDPPGTKARLQAGEWDLTAHERDQAIAYAETQERVLRADARYQREEADYEQKKKWADESNDVLTQMYKGTLPRGTLANSTLPREIRENLSHFQAFLTEDRNNKKHPSSMLELWLDINANSDDKRKIYTNDKVVKFALEHRISAIEAEQASTWVANQKDENNRTIGSKLSQAMNEVGRAVSADLTVNWSPQNVAAIQMDYQARVFEKVADLRQAGENPNQVFDPKSKAFVGSPEFIGQSIRNIKNKMREDGVNSAIKAGDMVSRDGRQWQFLGGDPKQPASWKDVGATTGVTPPASKPVIGTTGQFEEIRKQEEARIQQTFGAAGKH